MVTPRMTQRLGSMGTWRGLLPEIMDFKLLGDTILLHTKLISLGLCTQEVRKGVCLFA